MTTFRVFWLILIFSSTFARADNLFIKGGLSSNDTDEHGLFVGYEGRVKDSIFVYRFEGGLFTDRDTVYTGLLSTTAGLQVKPLGPFYITVTTGPALVTRDTDSRLGGNLQFNSELEFGITNGRGVSVGLSYKHISNGNLTSPNGGRDLIMLNLHLFKF